MLANPGWTILAFSNEMADFAAVRFLLVRIAGLTCATEVNSVVEILPVPPTTRIPGAPPEVTGLINIRGRLVTLVDGSRCLGQASESEPGSVVLLDVRGKTLGFAVDEVLDLVTAEAGRVASREDLPGVESRFVKGVAHHGTETFVVLDINALVDWVLPSLRS